MFGFAEIRYYAELLHETQSVPVYPRFRYLARSEASNAYPGGGDLFPCGRNPAEIALMRCPAGPPRRHHIAFGNHVLDCHSQVWEGAAVETRSLLLVLRAAPKIGRGRIMVDVVRSQQLVCHHQIALVPQFFEQT